jgi:hypothetical protein
MAYTQGSSLGEVATGCSKVANHGVKVGQQAMASGHVVLTVVKVALN